MPSLTPRTTARLGPGRAAACLSVLGLLCLLVSLSSACFDDFGAGCEPHFESSGPCELACNASSVVVINGVRYCTQQCALDNSCPFGTVCVRFAPGDRPESACLPPCRTGADCPSGFLGLCSPEGVCGL
jgi:hypothetical protein